ncbi:MAG: transcriptional repressor [Phycisphaerales bacterium]|nr:transcriptional repressor [Phycisphaerales bacterium]
MNASIPINDDGPLIEPMCAIFRRFLKKQGLKFTPERAIILESVLSKTGVFEAEQLLYEMRDAGLRVSKATIYRTLKHLLEARIISEVLIDSKQAHYQLTAGREPKAHLVCLETNLIIEFDCPSSNPSATRSAGNMALPPSATVWSSMACPPKLRINPNSKC